MRDVYSSEQLINRTGDKLHFQTISRLRSLAAMLKGFEDMYVLYIHLQSVTYHFSNNNIKFLFEQMFDIPPVRKNSTLVMSAKISPRQLILKMHTLNLCT